MKQLYTCLLILITFISSAQFRIVGYLNTWDNFPSNAANLDYKKITHLNIAFANPDASGNLTAFAGLPTVVKKAHNNNVKVLISLGGAELQGTSKNWKNLTQPDSVQSFAKKILAYL